MKKSDILRIIEELDELMYNNCIEEHSDSIEELDEINIFTYKGWRDELIVEYMGQHVFDTVDDSSWETYTVEEFKEILLQKVVNINRVLYATNKQLGIEY